MLNALVKFTILKRGVIGLKKIISVILAAAMAVTLMLPAMASTATSTDMGLENAIKSVKERIDIPKEFTKFSYDISNYGNQNSWRLTWSEEKANNNISVTIDENNMIRYYSAYNDSTSYDKKIPKYSEEQGLQIAEKFINKLDSKLLQQFKRVKATDYNSFDNNYNYNYIRQINGIVYSEDSIRVNVNKYTGEINNYNCDYNKDVSFEDSSKIISLDQAKKAFIDKLGLYLVYKVKTDENDKKTTYLAYVPKYSFKYIDAVTGNVETDTNSGRFTAFNTSEDSLKKFGGMAAGEKVALTPGELEAVKGMSDIISKEDIDKKMRAVAVLNIDSAFKLTDAYLNKGWRSNGDFIWNLNYSKLINKDTNESLEVSVSADARTGEIQNFWSTSSYDKDAKPIKTKEEAKAICDDVLKTLLPTKYAKLKYNDLNNDTGLVDSKTQSRFTFNYVRVENGIECPSESVNIAFDNLSGKVSSFDCSWTKDLVFVDPKPAITLEKAYDVLFSKIGYGIQYINDKIDDNDTSDKKIVPQTKSNKAVLGYFVSNDKPAVISAATGDILTQSGDLYKSNGISDYTDIKGLKAENQIKILTQMSIKYKESELKPQAEVLQKDYFMLLLKLNDSYNFDSLSDDKALEQMYIFLVRQGIITKNEQAPNSTMNREQAAKYFVRFLGMGKVAEIKGIYKTDFKDANKITPDLMGYVCIASGFKAINGSNGTFNPKGKFTRLDALLGIYSYLANK
jgi:hypothetical protein